jgi:hypothetical protein
MHFLDLLQHFNQLQDLTFTDKVRGLLFPRPKRHVFLKHIDTDFDFSDSESNRRLEYLIGHIKEHSYLRYIRSGWRSIVQVKTSTSSYGTALWTGVIWQAGVQFHAR